MTSGLTVTPVDENTVDMESNYLVIQTLMNGESQVYQAGRYFDRVVRTTQGWRYQSKKAIYDTLRAQSLLVTPV